MCMGKESRNGSSGIERGRVLEDGGCEGEWTGGERLVTGKRSWGGARGRVWKSERLRRENEGMVGAGDATLRFRRELVP